MIIDCWIDGAIDIFIFILGVLKLRLGAESPKTTQFISPFLDY